MPWKFTTQQPIYVQIVDMIEQRIFTGAYRMGDRLPSVRDLAMEASVNPNTMQRALGELEERMLVNTQRNTGRTVTGDEKIIRQARLEKARKLTELYKGDMAALGFNAGETIAFLTAKEDEDGRHSDNKRAD